METSRTLLRQLSDQGSDENWERFVSLYSPIIEHWLRCSTVRSSDIGDVLQEVLMALAQDLPRFQHNGRVGAFRCWLRQVTLNRCRRYWSSRTSQAASGSDTAYQMLGQLEDPNSPLVQAWNEEHDRHLLTKLLTRVRGDFQERTLQIFEKVALQGVPPKEVADQFSLSIGRVYKAKFRVMSRLQEEAMRLLDSVAVASAETNS